MVCDIKGIPVYYEVYGTGMPVLCIHGYSVDHRLMSGCLEPVFNQSTAFRRVYLDLPGMGRTPSADWIKNADVMLSIVEEFIKAIIGDEKFLLIGESFGGYLAMGILLHRKENIAGIMLLCPVVVQKNRRLPEKRVVFTSGLPDSAESDSDLEGFLDIAVVATPEAFDKYQKDILTGVACSDKDFLYQFFDASFNDSLEHEIQSFTFNNPSCILTGRQDHWVGFADAFYILERFPRATYVVLDGGGHNLQIENEPLFNLHVLDWLKRVEWMG